MKDLLEIQRVLPPIVRQTSTLQDVDPETIGRAVRDLIDVYDQLADESDGTEMIVNPGVHSVVMLLEGSDAYDSVHARLKGRHLPEPLTPMDLRIQSGRNARLSMTFPDETSESDPEYDRPLGVSNRQLGDVVRAFGTMIGQSELDIPGPSTELFIGTGFIHYWERMVTADRDRQVARVQLDPADPTSYRIQGVLVTDG